MTREEIIDELCRQKSDIVNAGGYVNRTDAQKNRFVQALSEGIQRLQQEPCEDAISRSHFDERVRLAGGLANDELSEDFKDGVLTVLEMLKNEQRVQPTAMIARVCIDTKDTKERLKKLLEDANLGIVSLDERINITPFEKLGPWISIPDVMSVFDDFSKGDADEDERNTFFEMLKDKAMEGRA